MVKKSRRILFAILAGVIFAFCYSAGYRLETFRILDLKQMEFYGQWLQLSVGIALFMFFFWEWMDRYLQEGRGLKLTEWLGSKKGIGRLVKMELSSPVAMILMLLCWIPALCSLFPGAFSYDALAEWEQIHAGALTSHHPVIHVLILGGLVEGLFQMTGSYNVGIFVYTVFQMIVFACALNETLRFMKEYRISALYRNITLLFYCVSPVFQLFAICATKDVLFTAAMLVLCMQLTRLFGNKRTFFEKRGNSGKLILSAIGTMILRNNGFYIVLVMLLIAGIACRKYLKQYLIIVCVVAVSYLAYVGPVYGLLHVAPGGVEEKLSVPIQQMGRVMCYHFDSVEQEDLEWMYGILPKDNVELYDADCADFIKKGFVRERYEADKGRFWRTWLSWGKTHVEAYVNAFLLNTVDFWYPNAVVDGYSGARGYCSYFDYQVSAPGTEVVLSQKLHDYYLWIARSKTAQEVPFGFLLLSPGWYFVLFFSGVMYLLRNKKYRVLLVMMVPLLNFATVLLGPMALVRYVLIFFAGMPLFISIILHTKHYFE